MANSLAQVAKSLAVRCAAFVKQSAASPELQTPTGLLRLLNALATYRQKVLALRYQNDQGTIILAGPFQGMDYLSQATEGCLLPRLLGGYESELHPHIEAFARAKLDAIIDIGCAEGYYAVGMARLAPETVVHAHDIDEDARRACAALAERNGVADRVKIGGRFEGEDFARFAGQDVLIIMDAEGAEDDLLDPAQWPALKGMNLIVETHGMYRPGVTERLTQRFGDSHDIELVRNAPAAAASPAFLGNLSHLDQLVCAWEWRAGPTPWLVMRPKG